MKKHQDNLFVTLTYEQEPRKGLSKRDVQLWLKKLRKKMSPKKFKYYLVGEYGTNTGRSHYHAILFNVTENDFQDTWQHGFVKVGTVTPKSLMYTTKYHTNVEKNNKLVYWYNKEFTLSSKNLGANYISKNRHFHKSRPEKCYYQYHEQKMPLPRYYKEKLYTRAERNKMNQIAKDGKFEFKKIDDYAFKHNVSWSEAIKYLIEKDKNYQRNFKKKINVNQKF